VAAGAAVAAPAGFGASVVGFAAAAGVAGSAGLAGAAVGVGGAAEEHAAITLLASSVDVIRNRRRERPPIPSLLFFLGWPGPSSTMAEKRRGRPASDSVPPLVDAASIAQRSLTSVTHWTSQGQRILPAGHASI
jgi:hypothetical protein